MVGDRVMSLFEALMLIAFGVSWPFSILKSLRAPSVEGKSLLFLGIIIFGYACGIIHKILHARDFLIIIYALNGLMVIADLLIVWYRRKDSGLRRLLRGARSGSA